MAEFRIDQVTPGAGTPGRARHDLVGGEVITLVATDPAPGAGVTHTWEIIDKSDSTAVLSATTGTSVTIGVAGLVLTPCGFKVRLTADDNGTVTTVDRVMSVRTLGTGLRLAMFAESAPLAATLDNHDVDESVDNALYADLAGLGTPAQNWRSFTEWAREVVFAVEANSGGPPGNNEVSQAASGQVLGTAPILVGSVYLRVGTIIALDSHLMMGTDQVGDTATLEIRRFTDASVLATIDAVGVLQDAQPSLDITVTVADWYDLYLSADVITTNALLFGIKLVYGILSPNLTIRQIHNEQQTGVTPIVIGSVYLPAGVLQGTSEVMLGTSAGGTATLEMRRFDTGAVVATWDVTGALADDPLGGDVVVAGGWHDLYLYGDAAPTLALLKGLDLLVVS